MSHLQSVTFFQNVYNRKWQLIYKKYQMLINFKYKNDLLSNTWLIRNN